MTGNNPDEDSRKAERNSPKESLEHTLKAEAEHYAQVAADEPDQAYENRERIVELLNSKVAPEAVQLGKERRAAASRALVRMARTAPDMIHDDVGPLLDALGTERPRDTPTEDDDAPAREITANLVQTIALVIEDDLETVAGIDAISAYTRAISPDLNTETLRLVTKASFECAHDYPTRLVPPVETMRELLRYPDDVIQAYAAGVVGRLAQEHPDAVVPAIEDIQPLLSHDNATVQHNAVEALGEIVSERPGAVVSVADDLRQLLSHTDEAIQHNAAGVFGHLVQEDPDTAVSAVEDLKHLLDHDNDAIHRIAAGILAHLAQERPDAIVDT